MISDAVRAVNPFIDRIPSAHDQDEFFDDYLNHVCEMGLVLDDVKKDKKCRFIVPYKWMIACARK